MFLCAKDSQETNPNTVKTGSPEKWKGHNYASGYSVRQPGGVGTKRDGAYPTA